MLRKNSCRCWFLSLHLSVILLICLIKLLWVLEDSEKQHNFDTLDAKLLKVSNAARKKGEIPNILHQTWKNRNPPHKYGNYRNIWLSLHPGWTHHLWTDEENEALVAKYYSWFLDIYLSYPVGIMRADVIRYIYMHRYGGMYSDLDIEPLRNLDFLLQQAKHPVTLAYMDCSAGKHKLPPSWMFSSPAHPFWLVALQRSQDVFKNADRKTRPEAVTGPVLLYNEVMEAYINLRAKTQGWHQIDVRELLRQCKSPIGDVEILEPNLIYPFDWRLGEENTVVGSVCSGLSDKQNETACKAYFPNAYTIQYSGQSWGSDWKNYIKQLDNKA